MGLRSPLVGFGTGGPIDSGVVGGGGTRNGTTSIPRSVFPTRPVSKSGSLQTGCFARSGGRSNGNRAARTRQPPAPSGRCEGLGSPLPTAVAAALSSEPPLPAWVAAAFPRSDGGRNQRGVPCRASTAPSAICAGARLNLAYLHSVVRPPARRKRGVLLTIRVPPFPRRRTPPSVTSRCRSTPIRSASTIASSPP